MFSQSPGIQELQIEPSPDVPSSLRQLICVLESFQQFSESRRPAAFKVNILGVDNEKRRFIGGEPERNDEVMVIELLRRIRSYLQFISDTLLVDRKLVGNEQKPAGSVSYCFFKSSSSCQSWPRNAKHVRPHFVASARQLRSKPDGERDCLPDWHA